MLLGTLASIDFTVFSDNPIEWFLTPFRMYFGALVWPMIFAAVIGFTWLASQKNAGVTATAIFLTFGAFGTTNAFIQAPEFSLFFSIIAIMGFAGTILVLFIKKGPW